MKSQQRPHCLQVDVVVPSNLFYALAAIFASIPQCNCTAHVNTSAWWFYYVRLAMAQKTEKESIVWLETKIQLSSEAVYNFLKCNSIHVSFPLFGEVLRSSRNSVSLTWAVCLVVTVVRLWSGSGQTNKALGKTRFNWLGGMAHTRQTIASMTTASLTHVPPWSCEQILERRKWKKQPHAGHTHGRTPHT